jgi:YD repeat-containing protein
MKHSNRCAVVAAIVAILIGTLGMVPACGSSSDSSVSSGEDSGRGSGGDLLLSTSAQQPLEAKAAPAAKARVEYEYDSLNRLSRVIYENGESIAYEYDAAGNIVDVAMDKKRADEAPEKVGQRRQR